MSLRKQLIKISITIVCLTLFSITANAKDKFKVVTTFTVIADMARNVAGDAAIVKSVTKPGAEIHGYEPTPRDLLRAQDADIILWNGLNLELWFTQFLDNLKDVPAVTLSEGVTPMSIREGDYQGKPNPHAWMSLESARIYVDNIRNAMMKYDPDNASAYEKNAGIYKEKLAKSLAPLRDMIRQVPEEKRWLVSCEGAFSYLARDLGLREMYLWPMNADQTGTPQQVRKVIDAVRNNNIPVVFCESTVNVDPAKQVARETGANYGGVLYVDSLSKSSGAVPTYLDLLRVTVETIANGLTESLKNQ